MNAGPPTSEPGSSPFSPVAARRVGDSISVMTEMVLPNDTNQLGNLFGGRLLQFMDVCAAIAAQRHAGRVCVTASVDSVDFRSPIRLGEIVNLEARVNRAFKTSMEVEVNVWAEDPSARYERRWSNRAYYTFVSVDEEGHPAPVPVLEPQTDDERERYTAAAHRRELRLVITGRVALRDTEHLRDHFLEAFR